MTAARQSRATGVRAILVAMGMNPYRKRVARKSDIVYVIAAVAIAAGLILWGFLG